MFPDIYAGHIIAIDGPKWLVTMRLPDAFVLTELGEGDHRTIKLPFEDLERIRAAGLLSIEGPLTPHVPEANADVPKLGAHRAADNDDRCRSGGDDPA